MPEQTPTNIIEFPDRPDPNRGKKAATAAVAAAAISLAGVGTAKMIEAGKQNSDAELTRQTLELNGNFIQGTTAVIQEGASYYNSPVKHEKNEYSEGNFDGLVPEDMVVQIKNPISVQGPDGYYIVTQNVFKGDTVPPSPTDISALAENAIALPYDQITFETEAGAPMDGGVLLTDGTIPAIANQVSVGWRE